VHARELEERKRLFEKAMRHADAVFKKFTEMWERQGMLIESLRMERERRERRRNRGITGYFCM